MKRTSLALSVLSLLLALWSLTSPVSATPRSDCKDYEIIYARGSGQAANISPEYLNLRRSLESNGINPGKITELDESHMEIGSHTYMASPIVGSPGAFLTGLTAYLSAGYIGAYRSSVDGGKDLLTKYLTNSNYVECGTRVVLVGYSQGAQVIGEALFDHRIKNFLPNITFVATFGDPTLDTRSLLGGDLSGYPAWYRGNSTQFISNGLLKVRKPYVPEMLKSKTGAWCDAADMMCSGNIMKLPNEVINGPHGKYSESAIPAAAAEIVTRLSKDLENPLPLPSCGAPKQDVVLNIDMSPTVRADTKTFGNNDLFNYKLNQLTGSACHVRIALHGYWRPEDNTPPQLLLDFTDDYSKVSTALRDLYMASDEKNITPTEAREGILSALDMNWRPDAEKIILTISNVGGTGDGWRNNLNMSPPKAFTDDLLTRQVIQKSYDRGGVELWAAEATRDTKKHTMLGPSFYNYFSTFFEATGGNMVKSSCGSGKDGCSWLLPTEHPPHISVQPIIGKAGEPITVNWTDISRGSIAQDEASFKWFLDCSGNPSSFYTYNSSFTYTFSSPQSCIGAVVAQQNTTYCYYCGGGFSRTLYDTAVSTFPISITDSGGEATNIAPLPIQNLTKTRYPDHISYHWEEPVNANEFDELVYVIRDSDGSVLGITRKPTLHIIDLPENEPIITISSSNGLSESNVISSDSVPLTLSQTFLNPPSLTPSPDSKPPATSLIRSISSYTTNSGGFPVYPTQAAPGKIQIQRNYDEVLGTNLTTTPTAPYDVSIDKPSILSLSIVAVPLAVVGLLSVGLITQTLSLSLSRWR